MEMLHKRHKYMLFVFFSILLLSCDKDLRYEKFQKVDTQAWHYKDNLLFNVSATNEETVDLTVALRNTTDFQHANLWLFLSIQSPSGKVLKDTLNCLLADNYGYWLGSGFSGLYLTEHRLSKPVFLNEKGDWSVKVTHGMRTDSIQGIQEVGILVRKVNRKE